MSNEIAVITPTSLAEAEALATTIAKSGMIPDYLRNKPADVLVVMMQGFELGLTPMAALNGIYAVKGRPFIAADTLVAVCVRRSDVCEYFRLIESTATVARYLTLRRGHPEPTPMTYTIEQARRANLAGSQTYKAHPEAMLRHRCSANLARAVFPDLCAGMYVKEEADEIRATVHPATVVAEVEAPQLEAEPVPPELVEARERCVAAAAAYASVDREAAIVETKRLFGQPGSAGIRACDDVADLDKTTALFDELVLISGGGRD